MGFVTSYREAFSSSEDFHSRKRIGRQELAKYNPQENGRVQTARAGSRKGKTEIGMGQQSFQFSNDIIKSDYILSSIATIVSCKREEARVYPKRSARRQKSSTQTQGRLF